MEAKSVEKLKYFLEQKVARHKQDAKELRSKQIQMGNMAGHSESRAESYQIALEKIKCLENEEKRNDGQIQRAREALQ